MTKHFRTLLPVLHRNPTDRLSGSVVWRIATVLVAAALGSATAVAQQPVITESGMRQIQTLLEEKASWSPAQRKLSSQLILEAKRHRGDALFSALPNLRTSLDVARDGTVQVDIRAAVGDDLLLRIEQLGGTVESSYPQYDSIRARMPLVELETLAAEEAVRSIRPADTMMLNKINTSEGDVAHRADLARATESVDGTGVVVGVLSDGVDSLASLQSSGDLPPVVNVLPGQAGSGSEGTAMLEIVYDLAPGANLYFATAFGGQAGFAQNILDLAAAGCDVIVDDVFYFAEGVFQDGIIAAAADQVSAAGVLYFSSAGNSGNLNDGTSGVWEGDFAPAVPPGPLTGFDTHDFGGGASLDTITQDSPFLFTLQWSDPLGGSGNDYDLVLLDATGTTIFAVGATTQDGDDDPFEFIDSGPFNDTGNTLAVVRFTGDGRYLHVNTQRGRLAMATAGQTSGHAAATHAFGVAATDWFNSSGGPFTGGPTNPVEMFSSDGPRRVFYRADGTPITPGDFSSTGGLVRFKPDITAADGVSTATPGFNPFFGTSAAAPHAAAIAALVLENANLTPQGMRAVFAAGALDIEAPGPDRDSGFGIVDALVSAGATSPTSMTCYVDDLVLTGVPNDGPQTFRACTSITTIDGTFTDVTGIAPTIAFENGSVFGPSSWGD
jgi:hypothetical protein